MNRIRFRHHRPTNHYDQSVQPLDEELCELIAKRKAVSNNNPGYPPTEQIKLWAEKYGLYENHLYSIFHCLYNEHIYSPKVEPRGFLGIKAVMRLVESDSNAYLITHLRQYENATVLYLQIDSRQENQEEDHRHVHIEWDLSIGPEYDCYHGDGSGNNQQMTHRFVVSPRLPDDLKDLSFNFKWKEKSFHDDREMKSGEIILG